MITYWAHSLYHSCGGTGEVNDDEEEVFSSLEPLRSTRRIFGGCRDLSGLTVGSEVYL
jgi:hypothetical protein